MILNRRSLLLGTIVCTALLTILTLWLIFRMRRFPLTTLATIRLLVFVTIAEIVCIDLDATEFSWKFILSENRFFNCLWNSFRSVKLLTITEPCTVQLTIFLYAI